MSGNTAFTEFPAESRIGRDNQVFDDNDVRQVSNLLQVSKKKKNKIELTHFRLLVRLQWILQRIKCSSSRAVSIQVSGFL